MIVGTGNIANALRNVDRKDILFFASGVSNSSETKADKFIRESDLLMRQNKKDHLVYFSSLSVYYSTSLYTEHKRKMEEVVKMYFRTYTIVRVGNLTFDKNPHTIINYLKEKIKTGSEFYTEATWRYILDIEEFIHWIKMIRIGVSDIMNITGKRVWVPDLVEDIKQGKYDNYDS